MHIVPKRLLLPLNLRRVENLVFSAIDATSTDYLELMKSQVCRLFTMT